MKRTGIQLLRPTRFSGTGFRPTDGSTSASRCRGSGRMTPVDAWTTLARSTLGVNQAGEYLGRVRTIRAMTRRFGADGVSHSSSTMACVRCSSRAWRTVRAVQRKSSGISPAAIPRCCLRPCWTNSEAFTADRETFITLVNEYLLGRATATGEDIPDIVAAAFETPLPVVRTVLLCETGRRLLAALTQFKNKHDINLLRSIAFPADAINCAGRTRRLLFTSCATLSHSNWRSTSRGAAAGSSTRPRNAGCSRSSSCSNSASTGCRPTESRRRASFCARGRRTASTPCSRRRAADSGWRPRSSKR